MEFNREEPPGIITGFWRGVGPNNNVFAIESFIEELARKAGKDSIAFRRAHLDKTPRLQAALDLVREKSGWGTPLPARCGRGVAAQISFASFIATVVECEVDEAGEVKLRRVTSAVDTGIAVNPDTMMAQLQGGLIFGLTAGLYGEITLKKGRVQQSNFHDYRMLRIDQVPADRCARDQEWRGAGRYWRDRRDRLDPSAPECNLCGDRRGAAADADRPPRACGQGVSVVRACILIAVLIVLMAAMVFTLKTLTKGPLAFAAGRTVALADYHAADPTGVPQNLANADQVKRGEYLARAADCLVCHTAPGSAGYAGGLAIPLPFGTLYTTNITPDKETGIGNYSDQDFLDALRRGKRRDGAHLYPAMPYTSYTYMTDADGLAIKAYLFSLPAVRATAPDNTFAFPFNQRWLMVFWSTHVQRGCPLRAQ